MVTNLRQLLARATAPIDGASLAAFRMLFGGLMCFSIIRFMAKGWVHQLYVKPDFFFTYYGFSWVQPWPAWGMHLHFGLLAVLALFVAAGLYYRISIVLFFLGFTYIELIDQTNYLNHYYFVSLVSFLMIFLPLHRTWSVDARRNPNLPNALQPAYIRWILLGQLSLVYFFAGLAKLNPDWLLNAQPLSIWLSARADFPLLGPLFAQQWTAYLMSWAGAAFDLTIPLWLLWKRSRPFAYGIVVVFHLLTALLFYIGMFPWIMIGATLLFFPPDWPRKLLGQKSVFSASAAAAKARFAVTPLARWGIGIYFLLQLLIPLRHHLYPGSLLWTGEGFRFAWNVMLVEKAGHVEFTVHDSVHQKQWTVAPSTYLTPLQEKMMATRPQMILQFAHFLGKVYRAKGFTSLEVRARSYTSLNGRPSRLLIDPSVNLLSYQRGLNHQPWILPLAKKQPRSALKN